MDCHGSLFSLAMINLLQPGWLSSLPVHLANDGLVLLLVTSILAQGARALRGDAQPSAGGRSEPLAAVSSPGSTNDRTKPA